MLKRNSSLKFFIKTKVVGNLRSLFLFIFGRKPNTQNWGNRILVVYLEAIGDTIILTSILKHFKSAFPGKEIHFLMNKNLDLESIVSQFIDKVIPLNYRRFISSPIYGFHLINNLRKIGYETVLSPDHSSAEIIGKSICVELGAKNIIGYEGFLLPFEKPFDANMEQKIDFVRNVINPKFTKVIPSIDKENTPKGGLNSVIKHYIKFYEGLTGNTEKDYAPEIRTTKTDDEKVEKILAGSNILKNSYIVINLGSSQAWKNWPVERFLKVGDFINQKGIPIVLTGSKDEKSIAQKFQRDYPGKCLNLVGQTSVSEAVSLVKNCKLVFSNDTAPVHIGIALKKPTLCILGGGHFGKISLYGYADINHWVYKRADCFGDNWQCAVNLKSGQITPCIDAVSVESVSESLEKLLSYLEKNPDAPKEKFSPSYLS